MEMEANESKVAKYMSTLALLQRDKEEVGNVILGYMIECQTKDNEIDILKKKISTYENALKEISELSYVKQDECCCIALGALDTYS